MELTEILIWLSSFWVYATVGLPTITEFIYEKIKEPSTTLWKSIWSWIIPIVLTYIVWIMGMLFNIGFLAEYQIWWTPAIFGAIAAGISNYSWGNILWLKEAIIQILGYLPKNKSTSNDVSNTKTTKTTRTYKTKK